jgi:hypothetical protein
MIKKATAGQKRGASRAIVRSRKGINLSSKLVSKSLQLATQNLNGCQIADAFTGQTDERPDLRDPAVGSVTTK